MPEPDRFESLASFDAADRDSRAELLLVDGLDQYFAGSYEDAIHIWTRVLFLDRTHSRARAYIDRARTALAERQRRTDELLDESYQLLGEGRAGPARHLLDEVAAESGEDERVSALRVRLERLEQFARLADAPRPAVEAGPSGRAGMPITPAPAKVTPKLRATPLVFVLAGLALIVGGLAGPDVAAWFGWRSTTASLVVNRPAPTSPQLSTSDVALIRARNAFGRGQLAEALLALERVSPDSAVHVEADALRIRIQQSLIASTPGRSRAEARHP